MIVRVVLEAELLLEHKAAMSRTAVRWEGGVQMVLLPPSSSVVRLYHDAFLDPDPDPV